MLYQFYEWNHAAMAPLRAVADVTRALYQNPLNPMAQTEFGRTIGAMAEVFERSTRVYGKPQFGLDETLVGGLRVPVADRAVWKTPFCTLLHFERALPAGRKAAPRILIVAPMSGHYATLLRGTVEALLPYADVYITDWTDARQVPLAAGRFDLDDYVDHLVEILHFLGEDTHVVGVCQPAVPVLMAVASMEAKGDPCAPASMTLMGGPIDTRINPTAVNKLAEDRGIDWFRQNVIMKVPFPQPGFLREVYPGFLQLTGFMSMNLDRHLDSHKDFFWHLVEGDGDGAEKHRVFYDEYKAVMDLTAEFYLQTVDEVFIKHSLPKGKITHRGERIDATKIRNTALLTIEGENDDISGLGQTEAAHTLCSSIPADKRVHYVQKDVGHYGVFNGSRFRAEIAPRIVDFALTHGRAGKKPAETLAAVRKGVESATRGSKASAELTDDAPVAVSSDSLAGAAAVAAVEGVASEPKIAAKAAPAQKGASVKAKKPTVARAPKKPAAAAPKSQPKAAVAAEPATKSVAKAPSVAAAPKPKAAAAPAERPAEKPKASTDRKASKPRPAAKAEVKAVVASGKSAAASPVAAKASAPAPAKAAEARPAAKTVEAKPPVAAAKPASSASAAAQASAAKPAKPGKSAEMVNSVPTNAAKPAVPVAGASRPEPAIVSNAVNAAPTAAKADAPDKPAAPAAPAASKASPSVEPASAPTPAPAAASPAPAEPAPTGRIRLSRQARRAAQSKRRAAR